VFAAPHGATRADARARIDAIGRHLAANRGVVLHPLTAGSRKLHGSVVESGMKSGMNGSSEHAAVSSADRTHGYDRYGGV